MCWGGGGIKIEALHLSRYLGFYIQAFTQVLDFFFFFIILLCFSFSLFYRNKRVVET